jgi:hypothetical protein
MFRNTLTRLDLRISHSLVVVGGPKPLPLQSHRQRVPITLLRPKRPPPRQEDHPCRRFQPPGQQHHHTPLTLPSRTFLPCPCPSPRASALQCQLPCLAQLLPSPPPRRHSPFLRLPRLNHRSSAPTARGWSASAGTAWTCSIKASATTRNSSSTLRRA